jgi:50S ribosomal subunit-associated GTPase HflX
VDEVLEEILKRRGDGPLAGRETLVLFNKVDLLSARRLSQLKEAWPDAFFVSAQNGKGLEALAAEFQRRSEIGFKREFFLLPADKAGLLAKYYDVLAVQEQKWGPRGVRVEAILKAPVPELEPYKTEQS